MQTIEEIKEKMKDIPGVDEFFAGAEIKQLPNLLSDDEIVEYMTKGVYQKGNGVVFATNKRVLFVDKGIFKLRVEEFHYDKISSIQFSTSGFHGNMTIYTSGNKAEIKHCPKNRMMIFVERVRSNIESVGKIMVTSTASVAAQPAEDTISQLERLAKLKEQGVLTDDEFNKQKQKILTS